MINFCIRNSLPFLLQKRFLPSFTAVSAPSSSFTVQFLVNSCGLSLESAVSASENVELHEKNVQQPRAVVDFLKSHGFDNAHLTKLVEKHPRILLSRLEETLKPKFNFFTENGFVGQLLHELVFSNPQILRRSLDSHIKPSVEFLRRFIDSNEKIVVACKNSPWLLMDDLEARMKPNMQFLLRVGVPAKRVSELLVRQPSVVLTSHGKMVDAVQSVKGLGLQPDASAFVDAIRVKLSISESNLRKKMQVFESMGWTQEEIVLIFKRKPMLLKHSEEKLRSRLDFYANNLNWGPPAVIVNPALLTYSLDKRIRPRYNVLKVLESKKLIEFDNMTTSWAYMGHDTFLRYFVMKYVDEVPDLLKLFLEQTMQKR